MPDAKSKRKPGAKRKDYRPRLPSRMERPRPDCVLKNLPEDQQEELWLRLRDKEQTTRMIRDHAAILAGRPISPHQFIAWRAWYDGKLRDERVLSQIAALASLGSLDATEMDDLRQRAAVAFMSSALEAEDPAAFTMAARVHLSGRELESKETGLEARLIRQDQEIKLKRQALEMAKGRFREQIADLLKNIGGPDAPMRLKALEVLIDSL